MIVLATATLLLWIKFLHKSIHFLSDYAIPASRFIHNIAVQHDLAVELGEEILESLETVSMNPSWSIHRALQKGSLSILE